jgi:hypothetical protein
VAGALASPAQALAVDHVSLFVSPSTVGAGPGWRLTASVPAPEFQGGEIVGVTLSRELENQTVVERHALRGSVATRSVSFDGRRGRWNVRNQLGTAFNANMAIRATGAARPLAEYRGCSGAFAQVPVALTGMLVLRTQTRFFGTIRRVRLRGVVIFNGAGTVTCGAAPSACTPITWLSATTTNTAASVYASPAGGGFFDLTFREPVDTASAATPVWYHSFSVSGSAPLVGSPPSVAVHVPVGLPVSGDGTFTARESAETTAGACRLAQTRGTFAGSFRARFTGWGTRTLELGNAEASYTEAR